jgi:hypothetical protein
VQTNVIINGGLLDDLGDMDADELDDLICYLCAPLNSVRDDVTEAS